ncbi:TetR/AcrR family transcriptional regulator [Limosilactobacillus reuteri]|uniref:TetR/AcrR family transcriptional regulator n=1 Tax=Limosilactobacillus reuteri TaxID=1598 RepID=UPI003994CC9C
MTEDIRRIKTKENIQNTFINIMAEQDLEEITVKAITSRARINKSTFYRNYADKYDLFYSIISNLLREYKATLSPDFFELVSIGSIAAIEKAINPIIDFFDQNKRTLLIIHSCQLSSILFDGMVTELHDVLIKKTDKKDSLVKSFYCTLIANNILTSIKWWHIYNNHRMSKMDFINVVTTTINEGIVSSID